MCKLLVEWIWTRLNTLLERFSLYPILISPSTYLQLLFHNVSDLMDVRKDIFDYIKSNHRDELGLEWEYSIHL